MSNLFDKEAEKLDALKSTLIAELNRDLFADGTEGRQTYVAIPRWRRWLYRVRLYLATMWKAIKGDDPYADSDY